MRTKEIITRTLEFPGWLSGSTPVTTVTRVSVAGDRRNEANLHYDYMPFEVPDLTVDRGRLTEALRGLLNREGHESAVESDGGTHWVSRAGRRLTFQASCGVTVTVSDVTVRRVLAFLEST